MTYAYTRPRYQVSVYRTKGPLLLFFAFCKDTYAIYCDLTAVKKSIFVKLGFTGIYTCIINLIFALTHRLWVLI